MRWTNIEERDYAFMFYLFGPHKFRRFAENLRRDGYVDGCRKVDLSAQFTRARELMGIDPSYT